MELPALDQLMGAYLHQDYDLSGGTVEAAAETFMHDEPDLARALPAEVAYVTEAYNEPALADLLDRLGCQVRPWAADGTYLTSLSDLARTAKRLYPQ